jgi:hypothetical protein
MRKLQISHELAQWNSFAIFKLPVGRFKSLHDDRVPEKLFRLRLMAFLRTPAADSGLTFFLYPCNLIKENASLRFKVLDLRSMKSDEPSYIGPPGPPGRQPTRPRAPMQEHARGCPAALPTPASARQECPPGERRRSLDRRALLPIAHKDSQVGDGPEKP